MANPLRISEKMRQGVFRALPTELSVNPKIERTRTRTEDTVFSKEVTLPIATDNILQGNQRKRGRYNCASANSAIKRLSTLTGTRTRTVVHHIVPNEVTEPLAIVSDATKLIQIFDTTKYYGIKSNLVL